MRDRQNVRGDKDYDMQVSCSPLSFSIGDSIVQTGRYAVVCLDKKSGGYHILSKDTPKCTVCSLDKITESINSQLYEVQSLDSFLPQRPNICIKFGQQGLQPIESLPISDKLSISFYGNQVIRYDNLSNISLIELVIDAKELKHTHTLWLKVPGGMDDLTDHIVDYVTYLRQLNTPHEYSAIKRETFFHVFKTYMKPATKKSQVFKNWTLLEDIYKKLEDSAPKTALLTYVACCVWFSEVKHKQRNSPENLWDAMVYNNRLRAFDSFHNKVATPFSNLSFRVSSN